MSSNNTTEEWNPLSMKPPTIEITPPDDEVVEETRIEVVGNQSTTTATTVNEETVTPPLNQTPRSIDHDMTSQEATQLLEEQHQEEEHVKEPEVIVQEEGEEETIQSTNGQSTASQVTTITILVKCDQCEGNSTIYCAECLQHLCEVHAEAHKTATKTQNHAVRSPSEDTTAHQREQRARKICAVHQKRYSMICNTCDSCYICKDCAITTHRSHDFIFIRDATKSIDHRFDVLTKETSRRIDTVLEKMTSIDNTIDSIEKQKEFELSILQEAYEALQKKLQERRDTIELELKEQCIVKIEKLLKVKKQLQSLVDISIANKELLKFEDEFETLEKEDAVADKYLQLIEVLKEPIPVYEKNTLRLLVDPYETLLQIAKWGQVVDQIPHPSCCIVSGEGISKATIGNSAQFDIELLTSNGTPVSDCEPSVIIELIAHDSEELTECRIEKRNLEGSFTVYYIPKLKGEYKISVLANGQHIAKSPYKVSVGQMQITDQSIFECTRVIGVMGDAPGHFNKPYFVAVRPDNGDVYVSDYNNNRIQVFGSNLEYKTSFGTKGNEEGKFKNPLGIAFDSRSNIVVCDYANHRVQVFDPDFNFVRLFGCEGMRNAQFKYPCGVTVDSEDNIYVVDKGNHRIQVFSSDGVFKRTFGSRGYDGSEFNFPWDIKVNMEGQVFVSDEDNSRIQVLDRTGQFLFQIGEQGNLLGQLYQPRSISLLERGEHQYLIVCDRNNHRIQIFNAHDGTFISSFGSHGSDQGQFGEPCGVAILKDGRIVVSEKEGRSQHRVQMFTVR